MPERKFKSGKAFWILVLIVDLVTRAFELDRGRHPKSLSELVPDYLDSVPVDPATGKELTYPK